MTIPVARASMIAVLALGACGTDTPSPELVVRDAAMGAGTVTVLGAGSGAIYWAVAGASTTQIAGSSLATLPADPRSIGQATGPAAHAGDHVVFATAPTIVRASVTTSPAKVATVVPEAVADSDEALPLAAWSVGPTVSWANGDLAGSATLSRITACDQLRVTDARIYVSAQGTSEQRLLAIDRATGAVIPLTASSPHAASFPGGATVGATYRGRLVGADALGASWLVEEIAAGATAPSRAILVSVSDQGATTVLLAHVGASSAFFTTADAFYWQEGDALLTAPRTGGAASIAGHLPKPAAAIDAGFVYFVDGTAIARLPLDAI